MRVIILIIDLTEEKKLLLKNIEEFAKLKIEPIAKDIDRDDHIPEELYRDMGKHGLLSLLISQEYGGLSLDNLTYAMVIETISKYSGGVGLSLEAHNSLGMNHVFLFGSKDLKDRVINDTLQSYKPIAWALTETTSGSDARNMKTNYVKRNNSYIINGSKIFITHGKSAKYIVVVANGDEGYTAFLVEGDSPGLERNKLEGKMGVRGSDTAEIFFNNVEVSKDNVIGKPGEGFKQVKEILDGGRIAIAAIGVGLAQASLDKIVEYVKQRRAFGSLLSEFEGIQFYIADLATNIQAARLLVYNAAMMKDHGENCRKEISMAKLFASQVAVDAGRFAIQIYGGYGYFRDFGIERYMRDAKLLEIGEGTSEIQKYIIAKEVLR